MRICQPGRPSRFGWKGKEEMDLLFQKQKRRTFLCALLLLFGIHQVIQGMFGTKSVEDSLLWIEISITQLAVAVFFSEMIVLVLISRWILGWGKLQETQHKKESSNYVRMIVLTTIWTFGCYMLKSLCGL